MCDPLPDDQIAKLAAIAGFTGDALRTAVAVALAESGGRPCAIGDEHLMDKTWGPSVGLWQVRTLKKESGLGTVRDINVLKDNPSAQAGAAYAISSGGRNWQPWTTYKTGAYRSFGDRAEQSARRVEQGQVSQVDRITNAVTDAVVPDELGDLADAAGHLSQLLTSRDTWLRVGKVMLGVSALVLGLAVVFRDSLSRAGMAAADVYTGGGASEVVA